PPGLPAIAHLTGQVLAQGSQYLMEVRRNHLTFDLLPVLDALHARAHLGQFVRPTEVILRRKPLPGVFDVRDKLSPVFFFEIGNSVALSLERDSWGLDRQLGQPDHPAAFRRN